MQGSEEADAAVKRLNDVVDAAEEEIRRLLRRLDTSPGTALLSSDRQALVNNQEVVRQVRVAIDQLRDKVRVEGRAAAIAAARAEAQRIGVSFTPKSAALISNIIADRLTEIDGIFGEAAQAVTRAARVVMATTKDANALADKVAVALKSTRSQALSAIDSVAMAAGRQTTIIDAERAAEGVETDIVYAYGGPVDAITRDFCREHATSVTNNVYTLDALNSFDNGPRQPKPVSVYLGGYKCRHNLIPMTEDEARRRGYNVVD